MTIQTNTPSDQNPLCRSRKPRKFVTYSLLILLMSNTSCGYLMHPERVGQKTGRLDPAVLILDGVSLFFGILPGIVAFAVDLTTGAIYLSPGEASVIDKHKKRHTNNYSIPSFPPHAMENQSLTLSEESINHIDRAQIALQLSRIIQQPVNKDALSFYKPSSQTKHVRASLPAQPVKKG